MNKTIYQDKKNFRFGYQALASELATVNRLLTMGYTKCKGFDLQQRALELEKKLKEFKKK